MFISSPLYKCDVTVFICMFCVSPSRAWLNIRHLYVIERFYQQWNFIPVTTKTDEHLCQHDRAEPKVEESIKSHWIEIWMSKPSWMHVIKRMAVQYFVCEPLEHHVTYVSLQLFCVTNFTYL